MLGLVLFNIFINDLEEATDSLLLSFQVIPNWEEELIISKAVLPTIQSDLDRWKELTSRNYMKLSKEKCLCFLSTHLSSSSTRQWTIPSLGLSVYLLRILSDTGKAIKQYWCESCFITT